MSQGWIVGTTCFRSVDAAASTLCASMNGVSGGGPVACTAHTVSGSTVTLTFQTLTPTPSTYSVDVPLPECDTLGAAEYGSLLGALVVALCVVWAWRAIVRVFDHQAV